MLGDLPDVDDEVILGTETSRADKQAEKLSRMLGGVDDRVEGPGDGLSAQEVEALTLEAREARWGFSYDELQAATKVVSRLFSTPWLYAGDPLLAESRLYTMVSRDRKAKRENKDAFKAVMNEERSRRQRKLREEDLATIRKTQMKQEREAALNALLLPPPPEDDEGGTKLITDVASSAASPVTATDEATTAATADEEEERLKMHRRQKCHTCKNAFTELHHYYYSLCPTCADLNYSKRFLTRDLRGKVVLLTGCRIKIGYAMAVSLLRAGATVLGTTRFVHDGLNRFLQEPDYEEWSGRLHLFAVDFRDLWMTNQFCGFIARHFPKIFAIVNNAAQTIARRPEYTAALRYYEAHPNTMVHDRLARDSLTVEWMSFFLTHSSVAVGQPMTLECHPLDPASAMPVPGTAGSPVLAIAAAPAVLSPVVLSSSPAAASTGNAETATATSASTVLATTARTNEGAVATMYPKPRYDRYDTDAEAGDLREKNSWTTNLADVDGGEAAEVMAINGLAPMIINSKLKHCLMNRDGESDKAEGRFIINVSAMEGQFYRFKQTTHPHTNMAKAALNMLTRTSGPDYAVDHIYMNSVDTGWITDESPLSKKQRRADEEKLCPLDEVDAAARCLDPIYTDSKEFGKFFKDFHEIPW
jgi:NAD(P)-dependent dehydrogenase (short-subunit alcohol dehydrogenase family)